MDLQKVPYEALPFFDTSRLDSIFNTSELTGDSTSSHCHPPDQSHRITQPHKPYAQTELADHPIYIAMKMDHLRLLVATHTPHLITICETWLNVLLADEELFLLSHSIIRQGTVEAFRGGYRLCEGGS